MGGRRVDLTGRQFGLWRVIKFDRTGIGATYWNCVCECGSERSIAGGELLRGKSQSCGCAGNGSHGMSKAPEYHSWSSMIQRCTNPNHGRWKDYGGRGIAVCERWKTFENFLADMGPRPLGTSIDRFPDPDGNYEPGNCRWATAKMQRANQRPRRQCAA